MLKPQVYNLADSNIANLGSDLERKVKEASANAEHAWDGCGEEPGLWIWRIEDFNVVAWPRENYGTFYDGDSYIVFHAFKEGDSDALHYDIHFWLGQETTMDEAGTAAYKTVELDTKFGDKPIQHREVSGFESPEFLALFPNLSTLSGGVDSGFNHVEPEKYEPRLLRVKGRFNNVQVRQLPLDAESLNSGDAFILDHGLNIYQFNGRTAGVFEKRKAAEVVAGMKNERGSAKSVVVDEDTSDDGDAFWGYFGGKQAISDGSELSDFEAADDSAKKLFTLSDEDGSLDFEPVAEGNLDRSMLKSEDVFVVDAGHTIYVWIGTGASEGEKGGAMAHAQRYCKDNYAGLPLSISVVQEAGCTDVVYKRMFA